jgi:adenylyltransferase/sulfurtransferase
MVRFTDEEVRRYSRQLILPEVGGVGQERLRAAHARAASEVEALYLAGAGVGCLTVASPELAEAARALNPLVDVRVESGGFADDEVETASLRALATLKRILEL